jgi:ferredoxin--NADP+ reductase
MPDEKWTTATVVDRQVWDDGLWTFRLDVEKDFKPGQFTTLALERGGELVKRAYSIASAPNRPLEFYVVVVDDGALTPSLWNLKQGEQVLVRDKAAGLFTLDRIPSGGTLWLVATGTGLAPYVSMLRDGCCFDRFEHVVIVHGVRYARQLGYREELERFVEKDPRFTYVPAVTRDDAPGCLKGRLTDLVENGQLEARVGRELGVGKGQVMLCGNPEMVELMIGLFKDRGMFVHRPKEPGHVHTERYW